MCKSEVVIIGKDLPSISTACLLQNFGISTCIVSHKIDLWHQCEDINTYYWDCNSGAVSKLFKELSIDCPAFFKKKDYVDYIYVDGKKIIRPYGWKEYEKVLVKEFPEQKEEIRIFFEMMQSIADEWKRILEAGSVFGAGRLEKMLIYRDVSYLEYLDKLINDKKLKKILSIDCVKSHAALPVIAGYMVTQIFDGHFVDSSENVKSYLKELYIQKGGLWIEDCRIQNIIRGSSSRFSILLSNASEIDANIVVSSYEPYVTEKIYNIGLMLEKNYAQQDIIQCFVAKCSLKDKAKTDKSPLRLKTFLNYKKEEYRIVVNIFASQKEDRAVIRFDVPIEGKENFIFGDKLEDVVRQDVVLKDYIADMDIIYPVENESQGALQPDFYGWEFTCQEIKRNVMLQSTAQDGIFTLGQWGDAWFTAALLVAKAIMKNR